MEPSKENETEAAATACTAHHPKSIPHANDGSNDQHGSMRIARPVPYHALNGSVKLLVSAAARVTGDAATAPV